MGTMIHAPSLRLRPNRTVTIILYSVLGLFFLIALAVSLYVTFVNAPADYEVPATFTIEPGTSVREVANVLSQQNIVRSETFLYLVLVTFHDPTSIKASTYVLDERLSTMAIAQRLVIGDFGNDLVRLTHIEGERAEQVAETAESILVDFDRATFLAQAIPREGRLFPNTYFVPKTYTASELLALFEKSFTEAIAPYESQIAASPLTLEQVLILASIIEREANTPESMRLVASVLLNRLEIGMPLQADASIEYILDKPLSELTPEDLTVDSPYNTYINPGLPPTPIGSPGLDSIEAVLEPTPSEYFYYITDDTGTFHFSETYQQHLTNIDRYLR